MRARQEEEEQKQMKKVKKYYQREELSIHNRWNSWRTEKNEHYPFRNLSSVSR